MPLTIATMHLMGRHRRAGATLEVQTPNVTSQLRYGPTSSPCTLAPGRRHACWHGLNAGSSCYTFRPFTRCARTLFAFVSPTQLSASTPLAQVLCIGPRIAI